MEQGDSKQLEAGTQPTMNDVSELPVVNGEGDGVVVDPNNPNRGQNRVATVMITGYTDYNNKYKFTALIFGLLDEEYAELKKHRRSLEELSEDEKSKCSLYCNLHLGYNIIYAGGHKYVNFIIDRFGYKLKNFSPECQGNSKAFWTLEK